jgi:tetratricopeptide (TPR) repeat protein
LSGGLKVRRLLLLAAALGGGLGAYWSARLAYGEILYSRGTAESIARAAGLAPGDAQYGKRRAELAEAAGPDAEKAEEALEAVLRTKPGDAETLIKLGLRAEMRNDFAAAERDLLEAARHDRGYDPRWSLANYYFRRQDGENFWRWARAACEMAYEPAPLFRLLWNYTEDSGEILDRAIPRRPEILRQYLGFLVGGPHWESADAVAKRILERPATEDVPVLMAYCDRLLGARRGRAALELWNALARRKLSGFGELDPERGPVNGGFATSPTNRGFDWRLAAVEGVTASHDRPVVRLSFSGAEPEACEPLWQYVMLEAGARYQMTFECATRGVAEGSGLRWRVEDLSGKPTVIAESEDLAHGGWRDGSVRFTTPAGMLLGRIVLSYRRAPGTTRTEGSIRLRNIALGRVN